MDERVFDISKPHHRKPDPTGKPVIVGHHPQMPDPMVRESAPDRPQGGPPLGSTGLSDGSPAGPDLPPIPPVAPSNSFMEQPQLETPPEPKMPDLATPGTVQEPMPPNLAAPTAPADPPPATPHNDLPAGHQGAPTAQQGGKVSWHPSSELPIPAHHGHHSHGRRSKKIPLLIIGLVIVSVALYALADSGVFGSSIKMPVHIFKQDEPVVQQVTAPPPPASTASTLPTGFASYKVENTDISFAYPTSWGLPTTVSDPGFSKRGGTNQSNGTYAYLVNFATNKDVQVAITSSQYLPAARAALYYDYQRWCKGTADGKYYKQLLRFSTTAGVDTPTTVTCDQGPLDGAAGLEGQEAVLVQLKTANPDGSALGDLYTANLRNNDWPVLRIKDAMSANADNIKKLLITIKN